MEFKTKPFYVINRWWEKIIANEKWIMITDNKEVIEVILTIFKEENLVVKKEEWKLLKKK